MPWESIGPGSLVRIFYRSTPYADKWVINNTGTADAPIVVLGVPDGGRLPRVTGDGARTRTQLSYWTEDRAIIKVGGGSTPAGPAEHVFVECLELLGAKPGLSFTSRSGSKVEYRDNAGCVFVESGDHITLRNNVIHGCGNGVFSAHESSNLRLIGNHIYDNGNPGSVYEHNSYTSSDGILFEFNRYGPLCDGCSGNNLKDRSSGTVVRYNWIEDGNRQLDLVESGTFSDRAAYRSTYVYGNLLIEPDGAGNRQVIHYGGDNGTTSTYRKGTLYFFHNTVVSTRSDNTTLVRLSTDDERMEAHNNIVYVSAGGSRLAIVDSSGHAVLSNNWLSSGWKTTHGSLSGSVSDSGTITGTEPGFVDADGQQFQLLPTSPGAGAGAAVSYPDHPLSWEYVRHTTGAPRADAAAPDLGAYGRP